MVYYSEDFFWKPARARDCSLYLRIDDGHAIRLDADNCKAKERLDCTCDPECGYGNYSSTYLTLDELKQLHKATAEAIKYYER